MMSLIFVSAITSVFVEEIVDIDKKNLVDRVVGRVMYRTTKNIIIYLFSVQYKVNVYKLNLLAQYTQ